MTKLAVDLMKKMLDSLKSLATSLGINKSSMSASRKSKKKSTASTSGSRKSKKRWYVLYGFNKNEESQTGYLSFKEAPSFKYEIVDDADLARYFPAENYDKASDFASPDKWLKFFNKEHELSDWKFHLIAKTRLPSKTK